jgi:hypothetical protein
MDRMPDIDEDEVESLRQERIADTVAGGDDDLDARIDANGIPTEDASGILVDRKDREEIAYYEDTDGSWKPYLVKQDDDVMIADSFSVRVLGPARDRRYFAAYKPEWFGRSIIPIEASAITDRAPLDSGETPMPIRPTPPEAA